LEDQGVNGKTTLKFGGGVKWIDMAL